jgi:hypothetical protein
MPEVAVELPDLALTTDKEFYEATDDVRIMQSL